MQSVKLTRWYDWEVEDSREAISHLPEATIEPKSIEKGGNATILS